MPRVPVQRMLGSMKRVLVGASGPLRIAADAVQRHDAVTTHDPGTVCSAPRWPSLVRPVRRTTLAMMGVAWLAAALACAPVAAATTCGGAAAAAAVGRPQPERAWTGRLS